MHDVFLLPLDDSKDMQHTAYTSFLSGMAFLVTNSLGCLQEIYAQELLIRQSFVLQPDDFVMNIFSNDEPCSILVQGGLMRGPCL